MRIGSHYLVDWLVDQGEDNSAVIQHPSLELARRIPLILENVIAEFLPHPTVQPLLSLIGAVIVLILEAEWLARAACPKFN